MKKNPRRHLRLIQTDHSVCAQCKRGELIDMPNSRYVLILSVFPWMVAILLSFTVHLIILIFEPILTIVNMHISKKKQKPLRRCKCHKIQRHLRAI